jgi:hypothetical protein
MLYAGAVDQGRRKGLAVIRRTHLALAVMAVLALVAFSAASSAVAATGHEHGPIKGIVPSRGQAHGGGGGPKSSKNLIYHGGSVLDTNTAYAIFWSPSNSGTPISASYESLINRFLTDVAHDTSLGLTSNVYFSDTQYGPEPYGSTATAPGSLKNFSTFGGAYVDTSPLTSGCVDRATSVCVSDSQVISEISKDIGTSSGWSGGQPTADGNHIFFLFTAKGVGSCFGSSCSFTQWCAYHSNSGSLLYANMPFADTVPSACDAGQHPNYSIDPNADATINVSSHEHNESITDPFGSAWYNGSGYENGDLCAWNFGAVGSNGANQTINGDPYILQQEWSNTTSRCVLTGT